MTDIQLLNLTIKQILLYAHLGLFAWAIVEVIHEDFRLLTNKVLNRDSLLNTADKLRALLIGLWTTGVLLVLMDTGLEVFAVWDKPKVLAKICVVIALSINAVALHKLAFKYLKNPPENIGKGAAVCAVLGGISTATWLFAGFLGTARVIAPFMDYKGFMMLYGAVLAVAIPAALAIAQPRLVRMMEAKEVKPEPTLQQQIHTVLRSCVGPVYQWLIQDAHKEGADKLIDTPRLYVDALAAQIPVNMLATKGRFYQRAAELLDKDQLNRDRIGL